MKRYWYFIFLGAALSFALASCRHVRVSVPDGHSGARYGPPPSGGRATPAPPPPPQNQAPGRPPRRRR